MDCIYPGPMVSAAEAGREQIHPTLGLIKVGLNSYPDALDAVVGALIESGLFAPVSAPAAVTAAPMFRRRAPRLSDPAPEAEATAAPTSEE